jgi:hypothetical protein
VVKHVWEGSSVSVGGEGVAVSLPGVDGTLFMMDRSVAILMVGSRGVADVAVLSFGVPGLVFIMVASGAKVVMSVFVSIKRSEAWGGVRSVGCAVDWLGDSWLTVMWIGWCWAFHRQALSSLMVCHWNSGGAGV